MTQQTCTIDGSGQLLTIEQEGVSMPADYSFQCVNDYVHDSGRHFEELQCLALGMAGEIERLRAGMRGDYDLDAWLDWAKEKAALLAEVEALRGARSENELALLRMGLAQAREERDQLRAEVEALKAEREGKVLVPVEPTIEMIAALGFDGDVALAIGHAAISKELEQTYEAMLSAALAAKEA